MSSAPKTPVGPKGKNQLEPTTSLAIGAVLTAIRPLMEDVYKQGKEICGAKLKQVSAEKLVTLLANRAQDISRVKTLLCLEKPMYITDFYSSQFIRMSGNDRLEVTSPDVLEVAPRLIITGVAGQGKSILFRYLALHEIARKRLPLFIELRNFEHANNLTELLLTEIQVLGFPKDEYILNYLLDGGKCTLFLDAFDEVHHRVQLRARKQIEDFARSHPNCKVYISSRPSLNIESSSYFEVARLEHLEPDEAITALEKMCDESDNFLEIKSELEESNKRIRKLLTTPLMVALLLLHHRLSGKFPETEQAFFGDLFDVLLRRHDQTKGYTRQRHSNASELELLQLFGFLSFAMRQKATLELPRASLLEVSTEGVKFHGRDYQPDGALDDIVHGTNLILEEGATCRFAHKAIQEFYAAKFLVAQPESDVERFLRNRSTKWNLWEQLFEFIELIDPFIFYRHFLIPHIGKIAFRDESRRVQSDWKPSKNAYYDIFKDDVVAVLRGQIMGTRPTHMSVFYGMRRVHDVSTLLMEISDQIDWEKVDPPPEDPEGFELIKESINGVKIFPMSHLLMQDCGDVLRDGLKTVVTQSVLRSAECYEYVDHRTRQFGLFE